MPAAPPSQRRDRAQLSARLRAEGRTWPEIAEAFRSRYKVNARVAMRLAHGWSQREVAELWTSTWPDDPKTLKHISYWEQWPAESGHQPGLHVLACLARLYQCSAGDLLAGLGDYRHTDRAAITRTETGARTVLAALTGRRHDLLAPAGVSPGMGHSEAGACCITEFTSAEGNGTVEPGGAFEQAGAWSSSAEEYLIMAAARQAGDHSGRDGAGDITEATLEQLSDHVRRLAVAYLTGPMMPLFGELVLIRNRAYELLERTERLSQRADLYLVAGQLSCLLAGTSCDLGHPAAAIEQARAARTYAELIGHPGLWAYASGMLSTFFSIDGQHGRALQHARAGLARLGTGSAAVRLHSLEALAASRLGLDDKAGAALADAVRARDEASGDDDIHDLTGGMFTSTPAKQAYMAAMARTNLGQPQDAIAEATRAIELWTSGPAEECAAAALTVARIDVVTAHILLRDLDAASEALQPVLAIPSEQRTTIVARRLDSLERPLLTAPARKSALARDMASHIEAFRAGMPPPQLPAG
jgi:hypothetical protein